MMRSKSPLFLGAAFIFLISLAGLFFAIQSWMPFMWFLLIPGIFGILSWIALEIQMIFDFFTLKTTKHGMNMGLLIVLTLTLLVVTNFLSVRYNQTFDLSMAGQYTLSSQTKKIIDQSKDDIRVYFFYKQGLEGIDHSKKFFASFIKVYQEYSSRIKFEFIEMNSRPQLVKEFGANKGSGEAFIEYQGRRNRIETQISGLGLQNFSEQQFTNALIKTTRSSNKKIYFLQGHGERNLDNEKDEQGVSSLMQMLEKNSFTVGFLNLIEKNEIPIDASALIVVDPKQKLQKFELDLIQNYLSHGGSILIAFDEGFTAGFDPLLKQMGLVYEKKYIFNILNSPSGPVVNSQQPTVAVKYSSKSLITKEFTSNSSSIFLRPNYFSITTTPSYMSLDVLIQSPEASVALENFDSQDYKDKPASYNLGIEVSGLWNERLTQSFKAVLFSDADHLSNQFIFQNANRDLVLNTISLLAKEDDLISISAKEFKATTLKLPIPEFNQFYKFVVVGLFLPIPFIFLLISFIFWLRRRHA